MLPSSALITYWCFPRHTSPANSFGWLNPSDRWRRNISLVYNYLCIIIISLKFNDVEVLEIDFKPVTTLLHGISFDGKTQRNVSCLYRERRRQNCCPRREPVTIVSIGCTAIQPKITAPAFGVASLRYRLRIRSQQSKRFFLAKTG